MISILNRLFDSSIDEGPGGQSVAYEWKLAHLPGISVRLRKVLRSDNPKSLRQKSSASVVVPLWGRYTEEILRRELIWDRDRYNVVTHSPGVWVPQGELMPVKLRRSPLIGTRFYRRHEASRLTLDGNPARWQKIGEVMVDGCRQSNYEQCPRPVWIMFIDFIL